MPRAARSQSTSLPASHQLNAAIAFPSLENEVRGHWVRIASYYHSQLDSRSSREPNLEHNWKTTSDSIALFLASRIHAERCVLLKSCDVKHLKSLQQAVDEGVLDPESIRFQSIVPAIELFQL